MPKNFPPFTPGQTEKLAQILADTNKGFTGSELTQLLAQARIEDVDPNNTKWKRLYNAFAISQNKSKSAIGVLNFIYHALEPSRYIDNEEIFSERQEAVNTVLAFIGLKFSDNGKFVKIKKASNLSEAHERANKLRNKLKNRDVHPDILRFCKAELLVDNYFHAVLEATKSIASKIRDKTNLDLDGGDLVDATFGGSSPILRINSFETLSHRSEQKGFLNLVKGLFGTFRNPTAHEARIEWEMSENDALDLLTIASYVHRRIDNSL